MLGALVFVVGFGLWASPTPPPLCDVAEEGEKTGDVFLYMSEIKRIHAGENYYRVASEELVKQGYPTKSVFNWRTPLPMWLIGKMPEVMVGRLILIFAAAVMLLMAFEATAREQPNVYRLALPLVVISIGPLIPCFQGNVFVLTEVWSGVVMALSLCAYGVNRRFLGASMGIAALFLRELALPYCMLGLALAVWERRPKESLTWIIGLLGWSAFYALHYWKVSHLITADAHSHAQSWIRFGGTSFVLAVTQMNGWLVLLPVWVTVLYFAFAMLGFAGWNTAWGVRTGLTMCLYIVAFSIVGQEFNRYWGLLIAPLFCFGAVRAPASLIDLWRAARMPFVVRTSESILQIENS